MFLKDEIDFLGLHTGDYSMKIVESQQAEHIKFLAQAFIDQGQS